MPGRHSVPAQPRHPSSHRHEQPRADRQRGLRKWGLLGLAVAVVVGGSVYACNRWVGGCANTRDVVLAADPSIAPTVAEVIEPLTEAGFDVVCPSLPGYGFSGKPSSTSVTTARAVSAS